MLDRFHQIRILTTLFAAHYNEHEWPSRWSDFLKRITSKDRPIIQDHLALLDRPRMIRALAMSKVSDKAEEFPLLTQVGDVVLWREEPIGSFRTLYKTPLPGEAQVRIAYESMIDRYLQYLQRELPAAVVTENNLMARLFIPHGVEGDWEKLWADFVERTFSLQGLTNSFVMMLNSVKLSAQSGMGVPDIPLITDEQKLLIKAFWIGVLEYRKSKSSAASSTLSRLKGTYSEQFQKAHRLTRLFSKEALQQINPTKNNIEAVARRLEDIFETKTQKFHLSPIILPKVPDQAVRIASDDNPNVCYSCGFSKPKTELLKANRFVLGEPSQRPQSTYNQKEPKICRQCFAVSLTCPIKYGGDTVVLKLSLQNRDEYVAEAIENTLKMLTLSEFNLSAGRYLMLHCSEKIRKNDKNIPLSQGMGRKQYALFKVASLFAPEVFDFYNFTLYEGTAHVVLPRRHLRWLKWLMEVFSVNMFQLLHDKHGLSRFFSAIRRIEDEDVIAAIYSMMGAIKINTDLAKSQMETLRAEHVRCLEEESMKDKAQFYRDVAGLTGILYAFCQSVAANYGYNTGEARREVKKVIEDSYGPNEFSYGVVKHAKYSNTGTLEMDTRTHFRFREAERLLNEIIGPDRIGERRKEEGGKKRLSFYFPDDIASAFAYVLSSYPTEEDQKQLTTQLKLSLASCFPDYYSEREEE